MDTNRRGLLKLSLLPVVELFGTSAFATDYPTGWGPSGSIPKQTGYPEYLVGNFSGGFETMFKTVIVPKSSTPRTFRTNPKEFSLGYFGPSVQSYQLQNKKPAILVARGDTLFYEHYAFDRNSQMRFNGKSMSKGILSLACAAAFDLGLLKSLEDPIERYEPRLRGNPLGEVTLRNALNMSSGVDICQVNCSPETQYERLMKDGFLGPPSARAQNTDMEKTILSWAHGMQFKQGERFNYNSVDPNLVALAIRGASGRTISKFVYETIWEPMGSEGDASFLTDSKGFENVEAGFNAIARDWAKLGLLIANRGVINSKQVISEKWFSELSSLTADEKYLDFGRIPQKKEGYKFFFHRASRDAATLRFGGDFGQSIFCDQKTGVVLTILSVSHDGHHYLDLFERAKDLAR